MNKGYIVVGVAAVVIGFTFAVVAWTHILPYREDVSNAEPVDAVVLSSGVIEGKSPEGETIYKPNVTYRYVYEGTEYTSSSVFPGDVNPVSTRSRAQEIVDRYPAGERITAHVNTDDRETAFLIDQRAPLWFWAGPVIGGLMVLYGLYSIVQGIRGIEPPAEPA